MTALPAVAETNSIALVVRGDVSQPLQLTLEDIRAMPRTAVDYIERAAESRFEGTSISEVIRRARPRFVRAPCCSNVENACIVAYSSDNSRAIFSLYETDLRTPGNVVLAYVRDGEPLPASEGPLRLILPADRNHGRWVQRLQTLEIMVVAPPTAAAETNSIALNVRGEVNEPLQLTLESLRAMRRSRVFLTEKGTEIEYEGVLVSDIILDAKPRLAATCCSNAANACVIAYSSDGSRAVFSFNETDPKFPRRDVLLADTCDEKPLPASEGPLRLIVPADKNYGRWVRNVRTLELVVVGSAK